VKGVPEVKKAEMVQAEVSTKPSESDTPKTGKRNHDLDAFSINEFCRRHMISHGQYYKLKNAGKGPRESHAGGRVLITR
jgi:hypothetical protein